MLGRKKEKEILNHFGIFGAFGIVTIFFVAMLAPISCATTVLAPSMWNTYGDSYTGIAPSWTTHAIAKDNGDVAAKYSAYAQNDVSTEVTTSMGKGYSFTATQTKTSTFTVHWNVTYLIGLYSPFSQSSNCQVWMELKIYDITNFGVISDTTSTFVSISYMQTAQTSSSTPISQSANVGIITGHNYIVYCLIKSDANIYAPNYMTDSHTFALAGNLSSLSYT